MKTSKTIDIIFIRHLFLFSLLKEITEGNQRSKQKYDKYKFSNGLVQYVMSIFS